jgi:hypothetical protein
MFLNFQTEQDIQRVILETFGELQRPATIQELGKAIWSRSAIDGTRRSVEMTVQFAVYKMVRQGSIECVNGTHYQPEILTRLALIKD